MRYRFNTHLLELTPSASIALMDKAREMKAQGLDVISLAGGEPDFDTPSLASLAGIRAITSGQTHYTAGRGASLLRRRIARKLNEENGITCTPEQILVTPGAKAAIYCAGTCGSCWAVFRRWLCHYSAGAGKCRYSQNQAPDCQYPQ